MATVVVVAADVTVKNSVNVNRLIAGETITPGEVLYQLASDSKAYAADASTTAKATPIGVAINPAASGDYVYYVGAPGAIIDMGVTLTKGAWYCISGAAGSIELLTDLTAAEIISYVGYGDANGDLVYYPVATGLTA